MRIYLQHIGVRSSHDVDSLIEDRLVALSERQFIEAAHVKIERRADSSPPFRVSVTLEVPGTDFSVVSDDWTATAAAIKAVEQLSLKIARRLRKRRSSRVLASEKLAPARTPRWRGSAGRRGKVGRALR
jgi:hypothetical protein